MTISTVARCWVGKATPKTYQTDDLKSTLGFDCNFYFVKLYITSDIDSGAFRGPEAMGPAVVF
uniref:Uncharacterized protein n=1 Tax=Rhizobium leguminosarum TaxID=384 RepID=A0A179BU69_RHILE|nr:hypothetical protein A4U53_19635 [Rhizobium leguminosarum]